MAAISLLISIVQKKFKLLTPQGLGLWFSECQRKWNISIGHYEKIENGCHFINIDRMEKFQITDPPKVWVSGFSKCHGNRISLEN